MGTIGAGYVEPHRSACPIKLRNAVIYIAITASRRPCKKPKNKMKAPANARNVAAKSLR